MQLVIDLLRINPTQGLVVITYLWSVLIEVLAVP